MLADRLKTPAIAQMSQQGGYLSPVRQTKVWLGGARLVNRVRRHNWGGARRGRPYTFTEQGVAMLSSVLRSRRAIRVNIAIMRTFVRLREMLTTHKDLARKLAALERKYDAQF